MIIPDPRRMNWVNYGWKINLTLKNPFPPLLASVIHFIIGAVCWSLQNQGIVLLLLVHPVQPFVQLKLWILMYKRLVALRSVTWAVLRGTKPNILVCTFSMVLYLSVLVSIKHLLLQRTFFHNHKTQMPPWRIHCPIMSCLITVLLLCH